MCTFELFVFKSHSNTSGNKGPRENNLEIYKGSLMVNEENIGNSIQVLNNSYLKKYAWYKTLLS